MPRYMNPPNARNESIVRRYNKMKKSENPISATQFAREIGISLNMLEVALGKRVYAKPGKKH